MTHLPDIDSVTAVHIHTEGLIPHGVASHF